MSTEPSSCDRCGTFAPLQPSWDRALCAACLERRHDAETEPFAAVALLKGSWQVMTELGLPLFAWTIAVALCDVATSALSDRVSEDFLPNMLLKVGLAAVTADLFYSAVAIAAIHRIEHGHNPSWRAVWQQVAGRLAAVVPINLVVGFTAGLGMLACCFPGVVLATFFMLALPIALREQRGALDSLRRSWRRMRPVFWPAFLVYIGFVVPIIAIAMLPFLLLADDASQRGLGHAFEVVANVLLLPAAVLPAVAYAKLGKELPARQIKIDAPSGS